MLGTFFLTVVFDLTVAVQVGLLLGCGLFVGRMSGLFRVEQEAPKARDAIGTLRYRLYGALFFGAAARIDRAVQEVEAAPQGVHVVLDALQLVALDTTGLDALRQLHKAVLQRGDTLVVESLQAQPREVFERSGFGSWRVSRCRQRCPDTPHKHTPQVLSSRSGTRRIEGPCAHMQPPRRPTPACNSLPKMKPATLQPCCTPATGGPRGAVHMRCLAASRKDSTMHIPPRDTTPPSGASAPLATNNIPETSRTGAVLGHPGREHGAYGMVTDPAPGTPTPSPDERSVRGLGTETGRPAEEYLLDARGVRVPSRPTDPPAAVP